MPYTFVQDVPIDADVYAQIRSRLGTDAPPGLVSHVVLGREGGLRYVDVWESKDAWQAFHDGRLFPVVADVLAANGVEPDPSQLRTEEPDLVDVWLGA